MDRTDASPFTLFKFSFQLATCYKCTSHGSHNPPSAILLLWKHPSFTEYSGIGIVSLTDRQISQTPYRFVSKSLHIGFFSGGGAEGGVLISFSVWGSLNGQVVISFTIIKS